MRSCRTGSWIAVAAVLAACGGNGAGSPPTNPLVTGSSAPSTSAPSTSAPSTTPAPPRPTTTAPTTAAPTTAPAPSTTPADALAVLRSDGIAGVGFGAGADEAVAALIERFGQPDSDVVIGPDRDWSRAARGASVWSWPERVGSSRGPSTASTSS